MPKITHSQAIEARSALLQLAQMDNVPAVPTGMAIRRGVRALNSICEDIEEERLKLGERHIKRDEEGNKVVAETYPNGSPKSWATVDPDAFIKERDAFFAAEVDVPWSIPETFFAGITCQPALLMALGDLVTDELNGKGG